MSFAITIVIKGGTMINQDKNKHEHSEKFRAEAFRIAGYTAFTPFCALILKLILHDDPISVINQRWFPAQITASLAMLLLGYILLTIGLTLMIKLDRRVSQ